MPVAVRASSVRSSMEVGREADLVTAFGGPPSIEDNDGVVPLRLREHGSGSMLGLMEVVLVTGANGHIGSHVVRAFLGKGAKVVAFVRPGSDRRGLEGLDVEVREGNVLDEESIASALTGVDIVIHVAAPHRNFAADPSDILRPAVEGTKALLDACAAAHVKRVVVTSSGVTVGFAEDPSHPLDESHRAEGLKSVYARAKIAQEALALAEKRLEVVVLNPSGVFGPDDYRLTPATRALVGILQGDPVFMAVSVTDVRDVGRAHVLASERGKAGERYLVTGDVLTPEALSAAFADVFGITPKVMTPPRFLVNLMAWWEERKARSTGSDASITRDMLDDAWGKHLAYDAGKSRRELGMDYRPARDVFRDAGAWLVQREALKPSVAARLRARSKAS